MTYKISWLGDNANQFVQNHIYVRLWVQGG